jgi:hypothetical protein
LRLAGWADPHDTRGDGGCLGLAYPQGSVNQHDRNRPVGILLMPGVGVGLGPRRSSRRSPPVIASGSLLDINLRQSWQAEGAALRSIAGTSGFYPAGSGTFTRASVADWINVAGNGLETQAASGALRREAVRGALIEEAVTAQAYNSSLAGAVAGSPGTLPTSWTVSIPAGITRTIALGTTNNIPWIDITLTGIVTTAAQVSIIFAANNAVAALTGETWSASAFAAVTQGLGVLPNPIFTMAERNAGLTGLVFDGTAVLNGVFSRRTKTRLLNQATTAFVTWGCVTDSVPSSTDLTATPFTIRIGLPMLNQGQLTSPILTTNSGTVTRAADVLSVPVSLAGDFTAVFIGRLGAGPVARLFSASDGSNNNVREAFSSSPNLFVNQVVAGVSTGAIASITAPSVGSRFAYAARFTPTATAASLNGGALSTAVLSSAPSGINTLFIGNRFGGDRSWSDYIERVIVFPTAVSDATLQTYSTLATWGG